MRLSRLVIFVPLILTVFFFETIAGCDETGFDLTTLEKFEKSKFVVIAKGVSVEMATGEDKKNSLFGVSAITMVVEKSFKGRLAMGEELVLSGQRHNRYVASFRESDVGRRYLLFLCAPVSKPNIFVVTRGMNHWLPDVDSPVLRYRENDAAEDLLYLENQNSVKGKTRIYGSISINQDTYAELGGKKEIRTFRDVRVRIRGANKTYEVATNADGVFEIYGLPAGKYTILPEIPRGWRISDVTSYGSRGSDETAADLQITLRKGKHAFYRFDLDASNTVKGEVLDPLGNPYVGVCLEILPVDGTSSDSFLRNDCTNSRGEFEFEEVFGGDYHLVINKDGRIRSSEPFPKMFYPGTVNREEATVISVPEGSLIDGLVFSIRRTREVVLISGRLVSSDGAPVQNGFVSFAADTQDDSVNGTAWATTDQNGSFSIKVLRGLAGTLSATVALKPEQFQDCPQIRKIIEENEALEWRRLRSASIGVESKSDSDGLRLTLPIPSCDGAAVKGFIPVD